jgi:hypothetical protein
MAFTANETKSYANISADTANFTLRGGLYGVSINATWGGGSVTLQRLSNDGSTYITVLTAFTATGYATVSLPPGTYKLDVVTATAVYVEIIQVASGV